MDGKLWRKFIKTEAENFSGKLDHPYLRVEDDKASSRRINIDLRKLFRKLTDDYPTVLLKFLNT